MAIRDGSLIRNGRYRIEKLLARGGFGYVYLAFDNLTRERVVLKELNPALISDVEVLRRFVREGRTMIRLSHPNLVRAEGMFKNRGNYYLVLEHLTGGALSDYTERGRTLSLSRAAEIAVALCDALGYLHRAGIVHCDLNPSNVLFDAQGHPKLIDLGIAHVPDDLVHRHWQTRGDFGMGTVLYMAPEQLVGVRDDSRVDQYALGVILYQALSGRTYLDFDLRNTPSSYAENIKLVQSQLPEPPPNVPSEVQDVILRALSKDPQERYESMAEFRKALMSALFLHEPDKRQLRLAIPRPARSRARARNESADWPRWVWQALVAVNVLVMVIVALLLIGAT